MTGRSTEPPAVLHTAQPPAALKQSPTSSMAPLWKHFDDYTGPDCITPCPNEVLHKICSNLPFDVVKNFRLVCRIFGKIGNDHLNAQAHVCFKRTSFQELQRLSTSDLRKSIRSLCFDVNRYNEQFTFEKWRRVVRVTTNIGRSQENQDAYDRFRHYYVDQDAIVQEDLHVESIATLLRNCPKLHTVEIWSAYEDLRIMQKAVPVFADAGFSPRSRRGNFVHGVHAIKDVMQAANQTRTRLKRLFAGRLSQTLFHLEAVDTEIIKTGLEKVQCLSLEIDEPHPTTNFEATSWDKLSEGALSKLLGAASDVRYLSVRSRDSWSPAIATLYLNHIFGKHVFHYLQALHLRSVATNSKGLSKILIEHKETLRYVHLTNFNMVNNNDNWNDFFSVMCQQLPQARKFLLYGDWKGVEKFLAQESRLDVLTNNAGVMTPPKGSKTAQDFELQFGTNVLGSFLLTKLLLPIIEKTAASSPAGSVRVTFAGSLAVDLMSPTGGVAWTDNEPTLHGSQETNYGQSKAGNALLASALRRRVEKSGVISNAWNPGNLKSELQRHMPSVQAMFVNMIVYPVVNGAYTELFAGWGEEAGRPENAGKFIIPWGRFGPVRSDVAEAMENGGDEKLWEWCEKTSAQYA
ncbi:hypothetical protein D6C88_01093 [Aureobasidium pullulans]|nr:hypothetical protein D6C88_01093 [Aureobasidium pullulans]